MADASPTSRPSDRMSVTLAASATAGEVWQMADGRAGYLPAAAASGTKVFKTSGQVVVTKAAGVVLLDGQPVYWDHSANAATYKKVNDRDFYLGRCVGNATSAATSCTVNLNVDPRYDIELSRDGFKSVLVGTPAAGGFGYPVNLGGSLIFELSSTSEAQKVDAFGAGSTPDVSIGVASATHASDADSIAESVFVHLDGNNTNINAESDDGTTEVAATDTTADYTEGSDVANRVYVTMDFRNPADVQIYVNGALVLGSTVFNVNAAVGPLFPLVHLEKTSSTDVYKLAIDWFRVRLMEQ
jgi:hypothetical protein